MTTDKLYSSKLSRAQNLAFAQFEGVSSCPPFGIEEFDRGEITAEELWEKNVEWLIGVANTCRKISFPQL